MKKLILVTLFALFGLQMLGQGNFEIDDRTVYSIAEYTTAANKTWTFSCTDTYIQQMSITWADADDTDGTFKVQYSYDQGTTYTDATFGDKTIDAATGTKTIQDDVPVKCDYYRVTYTNGSNTAITITLNVKFTTYR